MGTAHTVLGDVTRAGVRQAAQGAAGARGCGDRRRARTIFASAHPLRYMHLSPRQRGLGQHKALYTHRPSLSVPLHAPCKHSKELGRLATMYGNPNPYLSLSRNPTQNQRPPLKKLWRKLDALPGEHSGQRARERPAGCGRAQPGHPPAAALRRPPRTAMAEKLWHGVAT